MDSEDGENLFTPNELARLRICAGMTQQQVGDWLGLGKSQAQRMEVRKRSLSGDQIIALAELFGVHPGEVLRPLPDPVERLNEKEALAVLIVRHLDEDQLAHWLELGRHLSTVE